MSVALSAQYDHTAVFLSETISFELTSVNALCQRSYIPAQNISKTLVQNVIISVPFIHFYYCNEDICVYSFF